ncbi:MAG: lamin tail domain-containing protein [Planctomycetes bacterium]|nr:lamin tail domain-containing protein [Planctomycetota bacterium]
MVGVFLERQSEVAAKDSCNVRQHHIGAFAVRCVMLVCLLASVAQAHVHTFAALGNLSILAMAQPMQDITALGDTVSPFPTDDSPATEKSPNAIDDDVNTKYLNFGGEGTGFCITPAEAGTVVGGLTFTTADDAPERTPIHFILYGSNYSITGPFAPIWSDEITDFKQAVPWPPLTKNATPIHFTNTKAYDHYKLVFTAVRDPAAANSMQIAEVEFLGVPEVGRPPQVSAGDDRIVILPYTTVKLDGIVEYYGGDPQLLTMEWSVQSAPDGVNFQDVVFDPNIFVEDPTVQLPAVGGLYTLRLLATDQAGEGTDTLQIAVVESMCPTGDMDEDCAVGLSDMKIFADYWLDDSGIGSTPGDFNGKDGVDMIDYSLFVENWNAEGPTIVINEFMAINDSKYPLEEGELLDEDMDSSDWIELFNTTNRAVSLKGWYLTVDPLDLTGWEFPNITLEPGETIIVFASGKDRDDPESQLHTDFVISSEAGYLALVKPDGETVVHSFWYPQQFPGISYGLTAVDGDASSTIELVSEGAAAYAIVPSDDSLAMDWVSPSFDHSGPEWKSGNTGVGYDIDDTYDSLIGLDVIEMRGNNESVYIRIPFEISDLTDLRNLDLKMKYDDAFIAYLNNSIPVSSANAPINATWNSGADFKHDDDQAINFVDFPLPEEYLSHLLPGQNVLAIHGLNKGLTSSDFLVLPKLTVERAGTSGISSMVAGFFPYPSPNDTNSSGITDLGPAIRNVTENPTPPAQNEDLVITAEVSQTYDPVDTVTLHYRVHFDGENEVPMLDDGTGPDTVAGDGVYTATIGSTAYSSGQMVRWYVTAQDGGGVLTREPMFLAPEDSPEYFGTVVTNPSVNTNLQIFQYFVQNVSAAGTRTGTRASVFFLNEFYDNVFIRLRGGNTTHGRKFAFNDGYHFRFDVNQPRADEINLNEKGAEPTYMRQVLSWETYALAQQPASLSFPLHVRRNGSYVDVRIFVEQPDRHLLRRVGLDDNGALYNMYSDLGQLDGEQVHRKKTRLYEDASDVLDLIAGISPSNPNRAAYIFDNVNIPAVINFLAASVLVHENDHTHKNFFIYRDTEGTGEWMFLPWDKDLTFGINNGISGIIADQDWPADSLRSPSHPFFGDSTHQKIDYQWNRLTDAVLKTPVSRQMYLRRLRTLMDEILQPSSTPLQQRYYENRIDQFVDQLDIELGGSAFYSNVDAIKTQYLAVRRNHFYVNHSINNPGYPGNAGIPDAQSPVTTVNIGTIDFNPVSANQDEEYIQLTNTAAYAVDISGWKLDNAVSHRFIPGTVIPAGGSVYVVPNAKAFRARAVAPTGGQQRFVQGNYRGHLSNWGETIELFDADNNLATSKTYAGNPSDVQRYLRISEIMYHPRNPDVPSAYNDEDFEFIELKNIGDSPLTLSEVKFTDGITYAFANGVSLATHGYLLVAKNPDAFSTRYTVPGNVEVFGPYEGSLSNAGETIKLEDETNSTIIEFDYNDKWFEITDGLGFSLTIKDVDNPDLDSWDNKSGWWPSAEIDGSPGEDDPDAAFDPDSIVISEILTHTDDLVYGDWIEIWNKTDSPVYIGGWFLSDDRDELMKYEIATGDPRATILSDSYVVFDSVNDFRNPGDPGSHVQFGLSEHGEDVYLTSGSGGVLTGEYSTEQENFGAAENGVTLGMYIKTDLSDDFVRLQTDTKGYANNNDPVIGPVVISEIMYNPQDPDPDADAEYIELTNLTGSEVHLYDPANPINTWQIKGVSYAFPQGVTLSANETILITRGDPATFRTTYGISAGIDIYGPYSGKLDNGGEKVTLIQLGEPDPITFEVPEIRIDRVNYSDGSHPVGTDPWPTTPDGGGKSLTRKVLADYGNDLANWQADDPSPGQ